MYKFSRVHVQLYFINKIGKAYSATAWETLSVRKSPVIQEYFHDYTFIQV